MAKAYYPKDGSFVAWTPDMVGALGSKSANGYEGMTTSAGKDSDWIRTTSAGIIPYQSGGASALGTSSWPFSTAYITAMHGNADTATKATYVKDSTDGGNISITYAKAGQSSTSWLASWNGKELGAISPSKLTVGSATSANQLTTARTIALGGYGSGSASFNGTGNITISDTKYGYSASITGNTTDTPYRRICYASPTGDWNDKSIICVVDAGYDGGGFGIVQIVLRSDQISNTTVTGRTHGSIKWLVRYGFAANQLIMKVNSPASTKVSDHYIDVYFKASGTYNAINIRVLNGGGRGGNDPRCWTFVTSSESSRAAMDVRTYTAEYLGTDNGTTNYSNTAGTLYTARSIQTNLGSTSAASFNGSANVTPGITGTLGVANGGTGATTAASARTNLGLGAAATYGVTTSATSGSTALITSGAVYSGLADKLSTSGGITTGNITTQSTAAADIGFFAKNTESGVGVSLEVGSGKTNHGVYSQKHNKWLMYADSSGTVYLDGKTLGKSVPADAKFTDTNTTYSAATTSAAGLMSAADKTKLDGIASGANNYTYTLPSATSSVLGGVKVGSNITVSSGTISLTKANVTAALGYTPPTSDTNTDTKVTQTVTTTNAAYPLLLAPSGQTATATTTSYFDSGVTLNPSTNTIAANVSGSSASCTGNAATATRATKLTASAKGSATNPVYVSSDGVPTACTYSLNKTVPSNAVFTDTKTVVMQSTQPTDTNVMIWINA